MVQIYRYLYRIGFPMKNHEHSKQFKIDTVWPYVFFSLVSAECFSLKNWWKSGKESNDSMSSANSCWKGFFDLPQLLRDQLNNQKKKKTSALCYFFSLFVSSIRKHCWIWNGSRICLGASSFSYIRPIEEEKVICASDGSPPRFIWHSRILDSGSLYRYTLNRY